MVEKMSCTVRDSDDLVGTETLLHAVFTNNGSVGM
jgi:hypothetical protein